MVEISSVINNIVQTVYRARGTQAIQESRLVAQGIGGIGRQISETSTLSDRFNSQWRAIGTTMRYAVAGGVVFGLARMATQLRDVQQQLGLMQAIGSPGGQPFSNQGITRLGQDLQRSAMDALTPINEINDATVNLLSTVQNVPQSDIPDIITNIGQAAKLSQTPIEDLTKAATTMNIAFGRSNNARTISQFTRMWFGLIQEAPGGVHAAPEIANQLAPLAAMFSLGQGPVGGQQSQAQMMGDILGVLRTGAPPATAMRGLTYLVQSIIQPTGKSRGALAGIGITPQTIEREGLQTNLMRLLTTITHTGNTRQLANMPDESLDQLDTSGGNLPGIPAAEITRLRAMIPRIHGIRAAVILAGQLRATNQRRSLSGDIDLMTQEQNNQVDAVHNIARAWEDFRKRSRLQEAVVAIDTMRLQAAQAFEPILNLGARGLSGGVRVAQHHRTATEIALLGGLGVGGLFGAGRWLGLLRGGGSGIARAEAVRDIGSAGAGNSPENPIYVIVVGQLFSGRGVGGGTTTAAEGAAGSAAARVARRVVPVGAAAAARAALMSPGGLVLGGVAVGTALTAHEIITRNANDPRAVGARRNPHIMDFLTAVQGAKYGTVNPRWMDIFTRYMRQEISPGRLSQLLGRADVEMTVNINRDGHIEKRTMHVPVDLWKNGAHPSTRGKKATRHG